MFKIIWKKRAKPQVDYVNVGKRKRYRSASNGVKMYHLTVYVTFAERKAIQELSEFQKIPVTAVIRNIIRQFLDRPKAG